MSLCSLCIHSEHELGISAGGRRLVENGSARGGIQIFAPGGEELCAQGGRKGGTEPKKSLQRAFKRRFMRTRKNPFFLKKNGVFKAMF